MPEAWRMPAADEYQGTKFKPAAADSYRCVIDSYRIRKDEEVLSQYNKDGHEEVWFFLAPLQIDGDDQALMVDTAGEELPEDKTFIFFFDPTRMGYQPRLARSRKFVASALNIPVEGTVNYPSLTALCEDLVGKEIIAQVEVQGDRNKVVDVRPIPRRVRRTRTEREPLVEAASRIFSDEDAPDVEAPPVVDDDSY